MRDVDLSDVPPLLRAAIRRRIKAIRDYLSPTKPPGHTAAYFAKRLGLTENGFHSLVRRWKQYGEAPRTSGARHKTVDAPRAPTPPARPLPQRTAALLEEIAEEIGPATTLAEIMRELRRRCESLSVRTPSAARIARHLSHVQATAPKNDSAPAQMVQPTRAYTSPPLLAFHYRILASRVRNLEGQSAHPTLSLAILLPERFIVAHSVSIEGPTPRSTAQMLLRAVALESPDADPRPVYFPAGVGDDWRKLKDELASCGTTHLPDLGAYPRTLLDKWVDSLGLPQRVEFPVERNARLEKISSLRAISTVLANAVALQNSKLGKPESGPVPPFAITSNQRSAALRSRLVTFSRRPARTIFDPKEPPSLVPSESSTAKKGGSSRLPEWLVQDDFPIFDKDGAS